MNKTRALSAAALPLVVAALLSCRTNHAPDAPAVTAGPQYCLEDSIYTFSAAASDPDGDSVAVRFDWGDSTASHWEGWFASWETVAFTHAWSDTGTYDVRVSVQDRQRTSDPSEGYAVQVVIRWPPETPVMPHGPDVGGQDSSYLFTSGADHPDGLPVAIRFAWGDGDTSEWSEFVPSGGPVSAKHSWSEPDTYAVTAQAKDTGELLSQWSPPHTFVVHPPYWSQLRIVGSAIITPDSKGFLIHVVNVGTVEAAVHSLAFDVTSEFLYMRDDFRIGADHAGFPIPNGIPGTGPGDTVHFTAPVTVAPDMSQMVELFFYGFHIDPLGADTSIKVPGRTFQFRFSDGSQITVRP